MTDDVKLLKEIVSALLMVVDNVKSCPHCDGCRHAAETALTVIHNLTDCQPGDKNVNIQVDIK